MNTQQYIEQNKDKFLNELFSFLKQPSISADPKYSKHVFQTAEMLKDNFNKIGLENTQLFQTKGFPIVYGEKILSSNLPTILIYGHYDVQPPDPLDLWESDPFSPEIRDGKIYARGACDDKGQFFMHVKAVEAMIATNELPCNVKFMIEGEEEVGSENLETFVKKNKDEWLLKQYPKVNGGIVALNPFTGEVKALVGGFSYVSSEFNRVTQAKRQPGSAFKPFVYAAAIENGLSPNSIVLDAPFIAEQGIGLKDWKPENYGKKFYGPSTLRKGIEYSRNLMTVRIAKILGLNKILDLSQKLDVYDEIPELLSVSLGAAETTLINLTSAYAPFVNGGKKPLNNSHCVIDNPESVNLVKPPTRIITPNKKNIEINQNSTILF